VEGSFGSLPFARPMPVIGPLLLVVGLILGGLGLVLLRSSGRGWRLGRLLAAAPQRSIEEAIAIAERGEGAYVRLHGRIDSEEEFPGDDAKPLVFRRRRLQRRLQRSLGREDWLTFDDERVAVPFSLTDRGSRVGVELEALGDGLVVVPRLSTGVAAELPAMLDGRPLPAMAADAPVRLRVEQVSTTDHGTACGVPRRMASGETVLGPGLGRPLILTTLEIDDAMRLLGSEQRRRLMVATGMLAATPIVLLVGVVAVVIGR
jgi:hypothetical protein